MAPALNLFWKILESQKKRLKFSEESCRTIHELGNIELYELGQTSRTVQCHSCLKHIPEGLTFCSCGVCFRLDEETIQRIKARFNALIVPYFLARVNHSRRQETRRSSVAKRSLESNGCPKRAWKRNKDSIVIMWRQYRNSQPAHGWTEEYCRYRDYLTTIDISDTAPWHQKHRCECTITVRWTRWVERALRFSLHELISQKCVAKTHPFMFLCFLSVFLGREGFVLLCCFCFVCYNYNDIGLKKIMMRIVYIGNITIIMTIIIIFQILVSQNVLGKLNFLCFFFFFKRFVFFICL